MVTLTYSFHNKWTGSCRVLEQSFPFGVWFGYFCFLGHRFHLYDFTVPGFSMGRRWRLKQRVPLGIPTYITQWIMAGRPLPFSQSNSVEFSYSLESSNIWTQCFHVTASFTSERSKIKFCTAFSCSSISRSLHSIWMQQMRIDYISTDENYTDIFRQ